MVGHLVGNLQVFGPPELINTYAHFLQSKPLMVWGVRLGLLVVVGLHITTAVQLSRGEQGGPAGRLLRAATAYGSTWQSRYMLVSGVVIAAFILYHLAHFTVLPVLASTAWAISPNSRPSCTARPCRMCTR